MQKLLILIDATTMKVETIDFDKKEKFEDNELKKDGSWVAVTHYVGLKRYEITEEFVSLVEAELNNRPRKRFDFRTPTEVFNQKVAFVT